MTIAHRRFDAGEVSLHVAEQGSGKPVVFLHGFPEGWFSWRAQMDALAGAGFRAIAPDLRGYGGSDKPRSKSRYKSSLVAGDVASLVRSLDAGPIPVVGHDWGAPIAYRLAMDHPELVSRLVIFNGPHPLQFTRVLKTSSAQRRRSWYIFMFQLPFVPELLLKRRGLGGVFRGVVDGAQLEEYERAFNQPGAAKAMIDFYRAARMRDARPRRPVFDKDVLVVWGMRDFALGPECLEGLERWLPRVRIERLPNVGHFVQQEAPGEVNAILLRELGE